MGRSRMASVIESSPRRKRSCFLRSHVDSFAISSQK